ncbi:CobW family GTP-binding protein [Pseudomonas sp. LS1212]|uniref:CobW family GTP-binding protein n=1 Tax=Pseudomonas sp. LS1212 TaxID=2972478 RepID=UPI00215B7F8B|nr:CobW family GTP-binding protein [Pseudomonas sp. LS1212]UVJ44022.1 CobW family GTP-binding protein [Pseudomonas sp. LS1212]
MLQNIPTHVIAGPLGAGKTTLIRHLMAQRPAGERWAILINEFGQVGLDAALLTTADDGIALGEVAGGCLCCVNGAPFQVGLGRLLRKARPDRLLIEPSGLGHPLQVMAQLREAPWQGVLAVQPGVMVLDAQALACGQPLPEAQQQALTSVELLILNKSHDLDVDKRLWITQQLPSVVLHWTEQAKLPLSLLPGIQAKAGSPVDKLVLPQGPVQMPAAWLDVSQPIIQIQNSDKGWSVGWRWHPTQRFEPGRVQCWLDGLNWRRAKLVIHSTADWQSVNALDRQPLHWQPSEWRRDSRIELIFTQPQDVSLLERGLRACLAV